MNFRRFSFNKVERECAKRQTVVGTVDQTFSHIMGVYGRIVERCQQMRKNVQ